jgi:hypothetical protein
VPTWTRKICRDLIILFITKDGSKRKASLEYDIWELALINIPPLLSWDEWVPEDRVMKWTETNLQKQSQLREAYNKKKPARSTTSASAISDRAHDGESRGRKRARDSSMDKAKVH